VRSPFRPAAGAAVVACLVAGVVLSNLGAITVPLSSRATVGDPVGIPASIPSGTSPKACSAIEAAFAGLNQTLFPTLCVRAAFGIAFERWGAANFSWGENGSMFPVYTFAFEYEQPCRNSSNGPPSSYCADTEFWLGNVTSATISGPFYTESPESVICLCQLYGSPPPSSPPWGGLGALVIGVALVGGVLAIVIAYSRLQPEHGS